MDLYPIEENATVAAVSACYKHRINRALGTIPIGEGRELVSDIETVSCRSGQTSALRLHATDALRRARRLPIGADRNDLRQLAYGLLWLDRRPNG